MPESIFEQLAPPHDLVSHATNVFMKTLHDDGRPMAVASRALIADMDPNSDFSRLISSGVEQLSLQVLEVDNAFQKVEATLQSDSPDLSATLRKNLAYLKAEWTGHRKRLGKIVWSSRDLAGRGEAVARDFSRDFLDYVADTSREEIAEVEAEIANYAKTLFHSASDDELHRELTELVSDVRELSGKMSTLLLSEGAPALKAAIEQKRNEIDSHERTLESSRQKLSSYGSAAVEVLALGANSAFIALTTVLPHVLVAPLGKVGAPFDTEYQTIYSNYEEVAKQISVAESQLRELFEQDDTLRKYLAPMQIAESGIKRLAPVIDVIGNVPWALRTDLSSLLVGVRKRCADFQGRINVTQSLYDALATVLRRYQVTITLPSK